jgi:hypothetical protein
VTTPPPTTSSSTIPTTSISVDTVQTADLRQNSSGVYADPDPEKKVDWLIDTFFFAVKNLFENGNDTLQLPDNELNNTGNLPFPYSEGISSWPEQISLWFQKEIIGM